MWGWSSFVKAGLEQMHGGGGFIAWACSAKGLGIWDSATLQTWF